MPSRKILTATLWQIASQAVMAVMSIVSSRLVAVALSKELVGYYNSSYGYLQIFGILADFGLYAIAVKELSRASEDRRPAVLSALLVLRVCTILFSLGIAILIAYSIPSWTHTPLRISILIAALVPFFTLLAGVFRTIFQVTYSMHIVFIAETVQRVCTMLLMAMLVFSLQMHSSGEERHLFFLILAGVCGAVFLFLFSLFFSLKRFPWSFSFDQGEFIALLRRAAPFGCAFLATALYRQSDLSLIAYLREDFALQNAEYGFAQRIAEMAYLVPTFLLNSTLPVASERHEKGEDTRIIMGRTLFLILLMSTISALFAFFWSRPLIQLLTNTSYLSTATSLGSDTALRGLSIPIFFNGLILFSFYALLTTHHTKALLWSMAIGVLCSLSINVWLIPSLGFVGATISSSVTHILLAILLLPQALNVLPVTLPAHACIILVFLALTLALMLFFMAPFLVTLKSILMGCAIVLALLLATMYTLFRRLATR
jgi:O-antigen/teichoic acid export membrane protein